MVINVQKMYSETIGDITVLFKLTGAKTVTINVQDKNKNGFIDNTMIVRHKMEDSIEDFNIYSRGIIRKHLEKIMKIANYRKDIKALQKTLKNVEDKGSVKYKKALALLSKLNADVERDARMLGLLMD